MKNIVIKIISALTISSVSLMTGKSYAQYDDSLSAKLSAFACQKGSGQSMSMVIPMIMNPMFYMGQGQSSNWYVTGLQLTKYLESASESQKNALIADYLNKTLSKCPNNFGQSEYNGFKKIVQCYWKTKKLVESC